MFHTDVRLSPFYSSSFLIQGQIQDAFKNVKLTNVKLIISSIAFLKHHIVKIFVFPVFSFFCSSVFRTQTGKLASSFSALLMLIIVRTGGSWKITRTDGEQIGMCCTCGLCGLARPHCLGLSVETVMTITVPEPLYQFACLERNVLGGITFSQKLKALPSLCFGSLKIEIGVLAVDQSESN